MVRELPGVDNEMPKHCAEERRGSRRRQNYQEWVAVGKLIFDGLKTIVNDFWKLPPWILFLLVFVLLCG